MFCCVRMYSYGRKIVNQETTAANIFRERGSEQENFFYMNAACQAMIVCSGKM